MKINNPEKMQNEKNSKTTCYNTNNKDCISLNYCSKIKEKFIVLKNEDPLQKNKMMHVKKRKKNGPYLKPKFSINNKSSFSLKTYDNTENKENKDNNESLQNIYLNFYKVYYDENGKKVKIIKNKNSFQKKKTKELILSQNSYTNFDSTLMKKRNIDRINQKFSTEFLDIKTYNSRLTGTKKNNKECKCKHLYIDTPSQITTTENKSNASQKVVKKYDTNKENNSNIKNNIYE